MASKNKFNEATRVQIPALVHLTRLGYTYIPRISEEKAGTFYDPQTNILTEIFRQQFCALNPEKAKQFNQILQEIRTELDNNDIGKAFYKRLTDVSTRLIDFNNPSRNVYHCTAEFTCKNGLEEFRPDITLFINGLPLVYIEVKKPNNKEGIVAERDREYHRRFPNKKLRRFNNITQLMIFSNNMEYDAKGGIVPVEGVFYCTAGKKSAPFNCFREENPTNETVAPFNQEYPYAPINAEIEHQILVNFNSEVIHNAPEYVTNKNVNTPTNRVLTSMCSPERLLYIIKYAIAYVHKQKELPDGGIETIDEKHIMRYQQLFASLAIRQKLSEGVKSGLVWHTQGSGKTALAYYLTNVLTDYYAEQSTVAQFYFIVDRLDLLEQATKELTARGLLVNTANSRKELMQLFRNNQATENNKGQREITVVNIQRFQEDKEKVDLPEYATKIQRIFIIDEAHRGYKPTGCFLANLFSADRNSIKIALTGTPLIGEERNSCAVFGDYLHTYYYDKSIQDGYTLKILREDIETSWKKKLQETVKGLEQLVQKQELRKAQIIEHENYISALAQYIIHDLRSFRSLHGDDTLGGMVICETSEQARRLYEYFENEYERLQPKPLKFKLPDGTTVVGEPIVEYKSANKPLKAGLILHDSDDKDTRKKIVTDFKENGTIDILIVFNMLLTGFDAPRLKRLYFGRKLKDHNLLQAITRVNRPYKDNRYGYLIDFADIKRNFEETNEAYLHELLRFNDPEEVGRENITDTVTQVLENPDEIIRNMREIQDKLFEFTTDNVEDFASEISTIEDKQQLIELRHVVTTARDMANLVRSFGSDELKEEFKQVDLPKIPLMLSELNHRIDMINLKERYNPDAGVQQTITDALADIEFSFNRIKTEEMEILASKIEQYKEKHRSVVHSLADFFDPDDPEYITLKELFLQRFKEHNFAFETTAKLDEETQAIDEILARIIALQKANKILLHKYNDDPKFARVHKRIVEENAARAKRQPKEDPIISESQSEILKMLCIIKSVIDAQVYDRNDILKKDAYFETTVMTLITQSLNDLNIASKRPDRTFIQSRIAGQYLDQYHQQFGIA